MQDVQQQILLPFNHRIVILEETEHIYIYIYIYIYITPNVSALIKSILESNMKSLFIKRKSEMSS